MIQISFIFKKTKQPMTLVEDVLMHTFTLGARLAL